MESIKCPSCGITEFDEEDYEVTYQQDGIDFDVTYFCTCPWCDKQWKYIERFRMTDSWNEW